MSPSARRVPSAVFPATSIPTESWARVFVWAIVIIFAAGMVVGFQASLAALTILGFGAAVAGVVQPQLGVLGVGILCTLDPLTRVFLLTGGVWRWNGLSYWLLVVIVLFLPSTLRRRDVHTSILWLLLAVLTIGLAISPDPASGIQHLLEIVSVLGLLVYYCRAWDGRASYYRAGMVCGTLSAVGSLAFLMQESTLPYINPNALVFFPLTGLFAICLGYPSEDLHFRRQGRYVVLAASNLVAVFLSGSRGGMLMGLGCALFLLLAQRSLRRGIVILMMVGLLGFGASVQFTQLQQGAMWKIHKMLNQSYSLTDRTNGRFDLALAALQLFGRQPLGVGTGGFAARWKDLSEVPGVTNFRPGRRTQAHSAWAKTLAENGAPGIVLLGCYVASFAVAGLRRTDRDKRMLGVLTTVVLAVAFLTTEFQDKGLWMLVAGVTVLLQPTAALPRRSRWAVGEPVPVAPVGQAW